MTMILDGSAGMTAPQGAVYNGLALATAQTSSSGTAIDFTNIPLWAQRITVMFRGVSLSGTDNILVQIGSGTFTTSGYVSTSGRVKDGSSANADQSTSGFICRSGGSAGTLSGMLTITQISAGVWVSNHSVKVATDEVVFGGGDVSIVGTLDRVRITRTGTNTFDAGTINIMYE